MRRISRMLLSKNLNLSDSHYDCYPVEICGEPLLCICLPCFDRLLRLHHSKSTLACQSWTIKVNRLFLLVSKINHLNDKVLRLRALDPSDKAWEDVHGGLLHPRHPPRNDHVPGEDGDHEDEDLDDSLLQLWHSFCHVMAHDRSKLGFAISLIIYIVLFLQSIGERMNKGSSMLIRWTNFNEKTRWK